MTGSHLTGGDSSGRYLLGIAGDTTLIWKDGIVDAVIPMRDDGIYLTDINSSGVAVGSTDKGGEMAAVFYRHGRVSRLPGERAKAASINDKGAIAGVAGGRPVLWRTPESQPEQLRLPPGMTAGTAHAISEEGVVVGMAVDPADRESPLPRPFAWHPDGRVEELLAPEGFPGAQIMSFLLVRGQWAAGGVRGSPASAGVRWNLSTGQRETFPGLGEISAINQHGWFTAPRFGGGQPRQWVLRLGDAPAIQLDIGASARSEAASATVQVLSDDGRTAAGTVPLARDDNDITLIAVMWKCR